MTSANSGKVSLTVLPCSKLPDLSVVLGIDVPKANWFALRKLKREKQTTDPQYAEGSSLTALCYAVYKSIEYKLKGEPTSLKKYGVSTMDCAYQNGQFLIRFNCPGRLSSLIRCLDATIQLLTPAKCNPGFKHACRNLNCKPDDNAFAELERQINKGVQVFAVGKVTLKAPKPRAGPKGKKGGEVSGEEKERQDSLKAEARYEAAMKLKPTENDDVEEVAKDAEAEEQVEEKAGGGPVTADEAKKCCEFIAKKLDGKFPKLGGGAGNAEFKNQGFTDHDVHYDIRCKPGLAAFLTASYIESSSECAVDVISGTIVVWVKAFDGKLRTISEKDAIKRWVSGKFDRLKEFVVPFVIYFMMNNDHRDCPDVDVLAKAARNGMGELVSEISGCLKA